MDALNTVVRWSKRGGWGRECWRVGVLYLFCEGNNMRAWEGRDGGGGGG